MRGVGKSILKWFAGMVIFVALLGGAYFKLEEFSAQKVHEFADRYSDFVHLEFDRALINPIDRSLSVWGLRCDFAIGSSCTAERVMVEKFDHEHNIPRFLKGSIKGVNVPVDFMNFGSFASEFRKMGYDELNFDLLAEYIYEDETKRLSVRKLNFDGTETCRVSAAFDLGDMKLHNPGISGLIGVSMLDGGLVWQDRSLTERLLNLSAETDQKDSQSYRAELLEGLQLETQKARSLGNGYAENFYAEMKKFIENPGELVIRVDPAEPVPLLYMFMGRNFEELLELYGVTVEAGNPRKNTENN